LYLSLGSESCQWHIKTKSIPTITAVAIADSTNNPSPEIQPITELPQTVSAVVKPWTLVPSLKIITAIKKQIPVTTCSMILVKPVFSCVKFNDYKTYNLAPNTNNKELVFISVFYNLIVFQVRLKFQLIMQF